MLVWKRRPIRIGSAAQAGGRLVPAQHHEDRGQPVLGVYVRQVVRPTVALVRVRLALCLDGEQEAALVVGHMNPEEAVHPPLQRPDLGEISVQRLDRVVLGEGDARPRQDPGEQPRILPEDSVHRLMR